MSDEIKPRWKPSYNPNGKEKFLGHAGEIDVYYEEGPSVPEKIPFVVLVADGVRKTDLTNRYNFDTFFLVDRELCWDPRGGPADIHIELWEKCEVMKLLMEHELIGEDTDA